jgi:hypothetical protein
MRIRAALEAFVNVWSERFNRLMVAGHVFLSLLVTASSAESCIRKAVVARGLSPGLVGLADTKAEDEAAARWADFPFAYGD